MAPKKNAAGGMWFAAPLTHLGKLTADSCLFTSLQAAVRNNACWYWYMNIVFHPVHYHILQQTQVLHTGSNTASRGRYYGNR